MSDSEESSVDENENVLKIKNTVVDNLKKMIQFWLYNAKERHYLKSLVKDLLAKKKEENCKKC